MRKVTQDRISGRAMKTRHSDLGAKGRRKGILQWLEDLATFSTIGDAPKRPPKALLNNVARWMEDHEAEIPVLMRNSPKNIQLVILRYASFVPQKIRHRVFAIAFESGDPQLVRSACARLWETKTDGTRFLRTIESLIGSSERADKENALRALGVCKMPKHRRLELVMPHINTLPYEVIEALRPVRRWRGKDLRILEELLRNTFGIRQATLELIKAADVPYDFLKETLAMRLLDPDDAVVESTVGIIRSLGSRAEPLVSNLRYALDSAEFRCKLFREALRDVRRACRAACGGKEKGRHGRVPPERPPEPVPLPCAMGFML
ncbi:MAG: hypothetical protein KatS3mg110_4424 [Pirellulaceae bacterium]|nr:MAG: hypothetical protein KatS3mg110_4424 [Pirellulaceae bacterium]